MNTGLDLTNVSTPSAPLGVLISPFQRFARLEAAGGLLLLACTALALIWANSAWAGSYFGLWQTKLTVGVPALTISKPLLLWINDGLMALFFFLVGLEIKREVLVGELASVRKATFPVVGAIGGVIGPAAIFWMLNKGGPGAAGWAIPTATDIAFALGILAMLGSRVPTGLKVVLAALAIVDDIAAILMIAFFYTADIYVVSLAVAGGALLLLIALNLAGARHPVWYVLPGLVLWVAMLKSGVHATIAGVVVAMTIPAQRRIDLSAYVGHCDGILQKMRGAGASVAEAGVQSIEDASDKVQTPLHQLEHALLPWVTFFIMPIFALANAGVVFAGGFGALLEPVSAGIILGLIFGKTIGIFSATWLAVKLGLASLPDRVRWSQMLGLGLLGGIGFTMSLFIGGLAYDSPALLDSAKMGVLCGSAIAGVSGFALLRWLGQRDQVATS